MIWRSSESRRSDKHWAALRPRFGMSWSQPRPSRNQLQERLRGPACGARPHSSRYRRARARRRGARAGGRDSKVAPPGPALPHHPAGHNVGLGRPPGGAQQGRSRLAGAVTVIGGKGGEKDSAILSGSSLRSLSLPRSGP